MRPVHADESVPSACTNVAVAPVTETVTLNPPVGGDGTHVQPQVTTKVWVQSPADCKWHEVDPLAH